MEHLFFDSIDEMRNQTGSHGPNYLRNHTAERDYFSPLSIVTSIQKPQEYLFSNYMDAWSFCVHTPNKHEFFHETYMHKHNFFELMYVQRGNVRVMIEGAETTYTQGNLCLLNRNTMHRETDMSNADIVYIGIDASLLTQWPKSFPPPFQYKSILNQFFSDNLSERADYKSVIYCINILDINTVHRPFTVDSAVAPKQSRSVIASGFFTQTDLCIIILLIISSVILNQQSPNSCNSNNSMIDYSFVFHNDKRSPFFNLLYHFVSLHRGEKE